MVADPDMPGCVSRNIEHLTDLLFDDAIVYLETNVEDAKLAATGRLDFDVKALGEIGKPPGCCSPAAFRAFILYRLLPYDVSIWGQMKDPMFWILTAISLITFYGVRVGFFVMVFAMILLGGPAADEYQLVSFILSFKGTQFVSSGVCMAVMAAVRYYICVLPDGTHTCDVNGPGAVQDLFSGAIDILGSCFLVWAAFLALPYSTRSAGLRDDYQHGDAGSQPERGGRLARLLTWDLACFALSLCLLACMTYLGTSETHSTSTPQHSAYLEYMEGSWQFRTSVFFARVFYSVLSFPFVAFMIPGLNGVLTHTTATGYNRQGMCVPYVLHPVPKAP
eukprot:TRINITY_DN39314_c0_g1_i1.p1 TRINITY_DN39314_c0_g1~~TRINITY_DN39314_c0_g1_i1.p1  ORF type:complete len:335 (+),score=45.84 TRINITY_DN39314_c0_g1_i1:158-1162(+)